MTLANKLTDERRRRLAAERMLELKQSQLMAAKRKLNQHAQLLTEEIVETRAEIVETRAEAAVIRGENQRVKSDLTAAHERIAVTERRLWQSIQTIDDGFAFYNIDNNMIMANNAYLAVLDNLEVIQPGVNYVTILQVMTDEGIVNLGDLSPEAWRQKMVDRMMVPAPEPVVIELWDGRFIKLVDQRGADGDMVSLQLDITASVNYEKQLEEARLVAESANRAKSAFLANMSHELRTPMNGVVGMAGVLRDTELDDEQKLFVDTIKSSGEALLVIINDVLDYSKIGANRLDLYPEPFDLEHTIQEVLMLMRPLASEKDLSLVLDYDIFLPKEVVGDPGRIRQVLTNLVGNAIKFTTDGHVMVRVTGLPDAQTQSITLHVMIEDTGIGIPADMVDHIFGEFNQVENERNRQFDGTGLGLAISQRLVEMMEGQIWVNSEEGVGSSFGFTVTLSYAADAQAQQPKLPEHLHHILIVDETAAYRSVLARQLQEMGAHVTTCANGSDALRQIDETVDLILADFNLSDAKPKALCAAFQSKVPHAPILMLTGNAKHAEHDAISDVVHGRLHKPVPLHALLAQFDNLNIKPRDSHGAAPPPEPKKRLMRILAAEDNKTNQLVFRKMIKNLAVDLTIANNGEEAVALYSEVSPDLIFMDISMPKMDGKEATKAIRALEGNSSHHVPIVALTAHAMNGDDAGILAAGLDHYLTKPLRKPEILSQIEAAHGPDMLPLTCDAAPSQVAG